MIRSGERPMGARQPPNAFSTSPSTRTSPKHSGRLSPTSPAKSASTSAGEHFNSPEMRPLNVKKATPGQVRNYILNLEQPGSQPNTGSPYNHRPESPTRRRPASPELHIAEKVSSSKHGHTAKSTRTASQVSLLSAKFESEPDGPYTLPKPARHKQATSNSDSVSWISAVPASPSRVKTPPSPPFATKKLDYAEIMRPELKEYQSPASPLYGSSPKSSSKRFPKELSSVCPVSPVNKIEHRVPLTERPPSPTRSDRALYNEKSPYATAPRPASPTTKHEVSRNVATTPRSQSPTHSAQTQSHSNTPNSSRSASPRRKMVGGGIPENQFSWADATLSSPTASKVGAVAASEESLPPPKPRRQGNDGWQTPSRTQTITETSPSRPTEVRSQLEHRSPSPKPRAQLEDFPKTAPLDLNGKSHKRNQWSTSGEVSPARSTKGERSPSPKLRREVATTRQEDESLNRSPSAASAFSWVSSDETLIIKRGDSTRLDTKTTSYEKQLKDISASPSSYEKQLKDISASRSSTLKSTNSSTSSRQAARPASPTHHVAFQNESAQTEVKLSQGYKSPSVSRASTMSPSVREDKREQVARSDTRTASPNRTEERFTAPASPRRPDERLPAPASPKAMVSPTTAPSTPSPTRDIKAIHTPNNESIPYTPQFEKSFSMFTSNSQPKPEFVNGDMKTSQPRTRQSLAPESLAVQEFEADRKRDKLTRHKTTSSMSSGISVAAQAANRPPSPGGSHTPATGFVVHNRAPSPKLGKTPLLPPPMPVFSYVPYEETESGTADQFSVDSAVTGHLDLPDEQPLDRAHSTASSRRGGGASPESPLYRQPTTKSERHVQLDRTNSAASKYSTKSSSSTADDWTTGGPSNSVLSRAQSIMSGHSIESTGSSNRSFSGSSGMSVTSVQTHLTAPSVGGRSPELSSAEFKPAAQVSPRLPSEKASKFTPAADQTASHSSKPRAGRVDQKPRSEHADQKRFDFDDTPLPRYDDLDINTMTMPNPKEAVPVKEPVTPLEKLVNDKLLRDIFFCYIFAIYIIA